MNSASMSAELEVFSPWRMPRKGRLDWIDFAKGIGIVLVVYGHVQQGLYLSGMDVPKYSYYVEKIIYSFHMQLFFFLSGVFVEKSLSKGTYPFLIDKVKAILYPYFVWSLLFGSLQIILSPYTNEKLTIWDLSFIAYKPIAHFWFLQALFFGYVIFAILRRYFGLAPILIIAMGMYIGKVLIYVGPLDDLLRLFVFMVMGALFANIVYNALPEKIAGGKVFISVGIFVVFWVSVFHFGIVNNPAAKFIGSCVGIASVLAVSLHYQGKQGKAPYNIVRYLGFTSLVIYILHPVGSAGARVVLSRALHIQDISLHLISGSVAGLTLPLLIYVFTKKLGIPYLFTLSKGSVVWRSLAK